MKLGKWHIKVSRMIEYWYVLEVEDGELEASYQSLQLQGLHVFLPYMEKLLRRQGIFSLVRVPLYINCLFIKSKDDTKKFLTSLHIPYQSITQLSTIEQHVLSRLMDDKFVIQQSTGLIKDGKTIVEQGPLQGFENEIKRIDRHKRFAYMKQDIAGLPLKLGLEITTKT